MFDFGIETFQYILKAFSSGLKCFTSEVQRFNIFLKVLTSELKLFKVFLKIGAKPTLEHCLLSHILLNNLFQSQIDVFGNVC
jgi:hypothetical protein